LELVDCVKTPHCYFTSKTEQSCEGQKRHNDQSTGTDFPDTSFLKEAGDTKKGAHFKSSEVGASQPLYNKGRESVASASATRRSHSSRIRGFASPDYSGFALSVDSLLLFI
jgi:hypothetical protein